MTWFQIQQLEYNQLPPKASQHAVKIKAKSGQLIEVLSKGSQTTGFSASTCYESYNLRSIYAYFSIFWSTLRFRKALRGLMTLGEGRVLLESGAPWLGDWAAAAADTCVGMGNGGGICLDLFTPCKAEKKDKRFRILCEAYRHMT